jgi:hypothetical protein
MLNKKILYTILLVLFTYFGHAKENSKIIAYFQQKDYILKEVNDFESLKIEVNKNNFSNQVIYIKTDQNVFGFLFDKDQYIINVFIENKKDEKLFFYLPSPEVDLLDKNLFNVALSNLYSFYYIDYEKKQIIHCVIENSKSSFQFFVLGENTYKEYKGELRKKLNYPVFNSINSIKNHSFKLKIKNKRKIKEEFLSNIRPYLLKILWNISNVR